MMEKHQITRCCMKKWVKSECVIYILSKVILREVYMDCMNVNKIECICVFKQVLRVYTCTCGTWRHPTAVCAASTPSSSSSAPNTAHTHNTAGIPSPLSSPTPAETHVSGVTKLNRPGILPPPSPLFPQGSGRCPTRRSGRRIARTPNTKASPLWIMSTVPGRNILLRCCCCCFCFIAITNSLVLPAFKTIKWQIIFQILQRKTAKGINIILYGRTEYVRRTHRRMPDRPSAPSILWVYRYLYISIPLHRTSTSFKRNHLINLSSISLITSHYHTITLFSPSPVCSIRIYRYTVHYYRYVLVLYTVLRVVCIQYR